MFSQCANPECHMTFNYCEGRLLRFSNVWPGHHLKENVCVKHLWLCDECNRDYVLEYKTNFGIILRSRLLGSLAQEEKQVLVCNCPQASEHSCSNPSQRRQQFVEEHTAGIARHFVNAH
jgi:hypothetical protein